MGCCHHYQFSAGGDDLFTVDVNRIRFRQRQVEYSLNIWQK